MPEPDASPAPKPARKWRVFITPKDPDAPKDVFTLQARSWTAAYKRATNMLYWPAVADLYVEEE